MTLTMPTTRFSKRMKSKGHSTDLTYFQMFLMIMILVLITREEDRKQTSLQTKHTGKALEVLIKTKVSIIHTWCKQVKVISS
jgi:hypothetical protein